MNKEIEFEAEDQRTIRMPVPATRSQVADLADLLTQAARDGFHLAGAAEIMGGHQRDPYTIGINMQLKREPS